MSKLYETLIGLTDERTLVLEDITEQTYRAAMSDRSERVALAGFLLGASGMFATMYSTQAILPELGHELRRRPCPRGPRRSRC